jgi:hypothetical protein
MKTHFCDELHGEIILKTLEDFNLLNTRSLQSF